jgi:hypothetical protein
MRNACRLLAVTAAGTALAFAATANAAVTIDSGDAGTAYVFDFTGQVGGNPEPGISGSLTLTFTGTSNGGTTYNFNYDLLNDSSLASRLRSFGFDTDSTVVGGSATGIYDNVGFGDNYPEGFGTVDVCFRADGGSNCTGGPNGLTSGSNALGTLSLTFGSAQSSVTLDNFVTRFQSIEGSSYGSSGIGVGTPVPAVPEPGTWALMLLGFAAVGWGLRRRPAAEPRIRVAYS